MQRFWNRIGQVGFWCTWPFIHVMIRLRHRTRVLVVHGDKVLVVMDWLGPGTWSLPGGGLHRHEQPIDGALRELCEETTLQLQPTDLTYHGEHKTINAQKHRYTYHLFVARLKAEPSVRRQNYELRDIAWIDRAELLASKRTGTVAREVIKGWWPR